MAILCDINQKMMTDDPYVTKYTIKNNNNI